MFDTAKILITLIFKPELNFLEQIECKTSSAPSSRNPRPNRRCVFPFKAREHGETFTECTVSGNNGRLWCATDTDKNGVMGGDDEWGVCSPKCIKKGI